MFPILRTILLGVVAKKSIDATAEHLSEEKTQKSQEEQEAQKAKNQEAEENSLIEMGEDFVGQMGATTVKTFKNSDNPGDWFNIQNSLASTVMSQGFDPDDLEDTVDSYQEIKDSRAQGPQVLESTLSEDEQKEAREYAIKLLEEQLDANMANMPDYGDVRSYYNEGSLMDWVLSHPVSFAADWVAEKTGADWYTTFSQKWLGKDGIFTIFNIPTYIKDGINGETEVRKDHWTDMFGNIKTEEDLIKYAAEKQEYIKELKENIDDPKKFAKAYYYATEGVNFSADKVMEYKNTVENEEANGVSKEEQTKPSNSLIGRNYLAEDIQKNEMMTNILYEINKTVGTKLCSMIPFVGPLVAGVVNVGVSALEEKTQDDSSMTTGDWVKLILKEGIGRYFIVNGISNVVGKIFKGGSGFTSTATSAGMQSSTENTIDAAGDIIDGNWGGLVGNGIEAGTGWKGAIKTVFKTGFKWFIGLFRKG